MLMTLEISPYWRKRRLSKILGRSAKNGIPKTVPKEDPLVQKRIESLDLCTSAQLSVV